MNPDRGGDFDKEIQNGGGNGTSSTAVLAAKTVARALVKRSSGGENHPGCLRLLSWCLGPLLASLSAGYAQGHSAVFFSRVDNAELLTTDQQSWIGSLLMLGLMFGTLSGGWLSDCVSRRWCLVLTSPLTVLGWAAIAAGEVSQTGIWGFYAGRLMTGVGSGAQLPIIMTYLCSLPVSPSLRPRLASLGPLFVCVGIVASYFAGLFLPWRAAAAAGAAFPVAAAAAASLMQRGDAAPIAHHENDCRSCTASSGSESDSNYSFSDSKELIVNKSDDRLAGKKTSCCDFFVRRLFILRPAALTAALFLTQAFTGAVTVSYYTSIIFTSFLGKQEHNGRDTQTDFWTEFGGTISVGLTYVVGYLLATTVLLTRFRRRTLLMASAAGMALSNIAISALARYGPALLEPTSQSAVTALMFSCFVLSYSSGFGPVPYIFLGELFPPEARGISTGTVSMAQFMFNFAAAKASPFLLSLLGPSATYLVFAAVCLCGGVLAAAAVPDTEKKTPEEIWRLFGRDANLSRSNRVANV